MSAVLEAQAAPACWVCGARSWAPFKQSTLSHGVAAEDFRITDARYGHTGRIDECKSCGFKQCVELDSVLSYYENLSDPAYDEGREQRALQARKTLEAIRRHKGAGRLLDIGAASGILVEQAAQCGFDAVGIEPSRHLAARAAEAGLNVREGVFPHPSVVGPFDVITLVDVIEHVTNPVQLLQELATHLSSDGLGVVTTPNVSSIAAKVLGRRWWHFRVAHIGYFNRATLLRALDAAGLQAVHVSSPPWYFRLDYAGERVLKYFPRFLRFSMPAVTRRMTVRLNFHDSLQVLFRKKAAA